MPVNVADWAKKIISLTKTITKFVRANLMSGQETENDRHFRAGTSQAEIIQMHDGIHGLR